MLNKTESGKLNYAHMQLYFIIMPKGQQNNIMSCSYLSLRIEVTKGEILYSFMMATWCRITARNVNANHIICCNPCYCHHLGNHSKLFNLFSSN
jgi:hypothetical protein